MSSLTIKMTTSQENLTVSAPADRLYRECRSTIINNFDFLKYSGPIFHYTSAETLPKIFLNEGICFRFSDYRGLNDSSEGKEIVSLIHEIAEEKRNDLTIDEAFYQLLIEIDESSIYGCSNDNLYVCSFSESSDLLPMWTYYLKGKKYEGYNVGIDFTPQEYLGSYPLIKRKVSYCEDHKRKVIEQLLRLLQNKYSKHPEAEIDMRNAWAKIIRELMLTFKDSAFEHEKEVRLILDLNEFKKWDDAPKAFRDETTCTLHIKEEGINCVHGIYVPYIDLILDRKDIVKSIISAPTMNKTDVQNSVSLLLDLRQYDMGIEIGHSKIPIRY